jgi:integrase
MKKGNHRTKGTLRFALKTPNKEGQSAIQIDFSLGTSRIRISTGYKVNPTYWDSDKQRVKNVLKAVNKDEINRELNELETFINDSISELRKEKSNLTKKDIQTIIKNFKVVEEKEQPKTLIEYFKLFIKFKEETLPTNRGNRNQTVEAYKQALKFLMLFQKETGFNVSFENIDINFYYQFRKYLESIEKSDGTKYSLNTIGKHLKTFKTFLNYASNNGWNKNFQYKLSEFKIPKEQTTAVYLTKDEKQKLFEYDFSKYPQLEETRDIFFIGCEIGQRVSDYNNLENAEIVIVEGKEYFKITQKKTGTTVYCFITDGIKYILNKRYNGKPPKSIPEQYLNNRIKEVAQMCGINTKIRFERTQGGKKVCQNVYKYELISSHTARRTFCTLLYNEDLPISSIMHQSGHKTEKEFKNYIRVEKEKEVAMIANKEEFLKSFVSIV